MAFDKYEAEKDPDSIVDYGRTWSNWLQEDEIILSSIWIITGTEDPITLVEGGQGTGISVDGKSTVIWLEGGADVQRYTLTNRIQTDQLRTEDRSGILTVREK